MARPSRRPSAPLIDQLYEEPWRFEPYEAVRILEEVRRGEGVPTEPLGDGEDPRREAVRFEHAVSFSFPASALKAVEPPRGKRGAARLVQSFIGLAGALGPLPRPVTEKLLENEKRGDGAMRAFLDIFNHRLAALMVRMRRKHRVALDPVPPQDSHFARYLFSFMGLGLEPLRDRTALEDRALLSYGGLVVQRPRSAAGLERIVADHFGVPVSVRPFDGAWHDLPVQARTALGTRLGRNAGLGREAVLGGRYWDQQTGFVLRIGPVPLDRFTDFLPAPRGRPEAEGVAFTALKPLARFYAGQEYAIRLNLVCAGGERPVARLGTGKGPEQSKAGAEGAGGMRLGWTSWLSSQPAGTDDDQVTVRLQAVGTA